MIALPLAGQLDEAWRERRAIPPPAELSALSLPEAYDVQDAVAAYRESAGLVRSGWKLGLTSDIKQRLMGIDRPVFGRLFAAGEIASGGVAARDSFIAPRAEPEIAFGLCGELDPAADVAELRKAIAWIAPALEITDSRYRSGIRTAVELVADNTSAAGYVLGARIAPDEAGPLDSIRTSVVRNGEVMAEGMSGDVLGSPLNALVLLATHLAKRGGKTCPGDIILSGAITDAFAAATGDRFEARFAGLETISVRFV